MRTTQKQRGGVTGAGFVKGQSGNPGGRPRSERELLRRLFGVDGHRVYARLEALRADPKTPVKLQIEIDFFIVERMFGRPQQQVDVTASEGLAGLLAALAARNSEARS